EGWAGAVDHDTQVLIDGRITEELALAGMAREVVRHVQELRKNAGLEMEDRIILYLATDSVRLQEAIETHRDYIASETLTANWARAGAGVPGMRQEGVQQGAQNADEVLAAHRPHFLEEQPPVLAHVPDEEIDLIAGSIGHGRLPFRQRGGMALVQMLDEPD